MRRALGIRAFPTYGTGCATWSRERRRSSRRRSPATKVLFGPLESRSRCSSVQGSGSRSVEGAPSRGRRGNGAEWRRGLVLSLIGLAPLLPGPTGLTPGNEGFANRLLIASAPFYPVLIVAVAFLASIGILRLVRRPRFAVPLAMVLLAGSWSSRW